LRHRGSRNKFAGIAVKNKGGATTFVKSPHTAVNALTRAYSRDSATRQYTSQRGNNQSSLGRLARRHPHRRAEIVGTGRMSPAPTMV
jgi:hypothetical protein